MLALGLLSPGAQPNEAMHYSSTIVKEHLEMNEKQQGTALKTDYKTRRGWFLRGAVTPLRTKSLKTATNCIFNLFSILVHNCLLHSTFIAKTQPRK